MSDDGVLLVRNLDFNAYDAVIRSKAVICEQCEATSHIAIVCRILGIPVLIAKGAMANFKPGDIVTVDTEGTRVYLGRTAAREGTRSDGKRLPDGMFSYQLSIVPEPELIERANAAGRLDIEQFFLREELLWVARHLDPFTHLATEGGEGLAELLIDALAPLSMALQPGQWLNYRALDIRSDQLTHFGGNAAVEANPHLGNHGVRRLLLTPSYIEAELRAVDRLYARGMTNIIYSLPFLTLEAELEAVLKLRDAVCEHTIPIGVFVETPSAVLELPYLLRHSLAAVYIGTKDLSQLVLAADRDNASVAHLLNANARPVRAAIESACASCDEHHTPVYVFTFAENLTYLADVLPRVTRISLPASDYLRAAGA